MSKGLVIVLENEEASRTFFRRTLQMRGYECAEVLTEDETLAVCRNHGGEVRALIAELILPTVWGTDVALAVSRFRSDIRILFVSGTPVSSWDLDLIRRMSQLPAGSFGFMGKPFKPRRFLSTLDRLLNACEFQQV